MLSQQKEKPMVLVVFCQGGLCSTVSVEGPLGLCVFRDGWVWGLQGHPCCWARWCGPMWRRWEQWWFFLYHTA
jgi:hypothetical protein